MNRPKRMAAALFGAILLPTMTLAQDIPSLPGGASSLLETFEDWTVTCQIVGKAKHCAASQQQKQQNGQRVLAIELQAEAGDTASATLIMPFGLRLADGVTLQIDDKPAMAAMPFSTCLPAGCIVPVKLDGPTLTALRGGTALKLTAKSGPNGQDIALAISLKGISPALDRIKSLLQE